MSMTTRLRRGGVLMTAAAAALVLSACTDGFFFDPAPAGLTPVSVQYSYVGGAEGPQAAGAAGAFDRADGAQVRVTTGERELFNQRVQLETVGADKKISLSLELPAGAAVSAAVQITLLQGTTELFTGSATASLTPGQAAEVTVPLAGVVGAVTVTAPAPVLRTLGGTVKLSTLGLFASGDTLGPVSATYRALGQAVSVAADGTVTAVSNGTAGVEATYLGKADTVTITVEDRCVGPYATIALGQTVNGTLEVNDCDDAANSSYNDWYQFTVATPTLVRATVTGTGFEPFVGANYTDKRTLAVAANAGAGQVISDYHLPAGTYLVRAGSRAGSVAAGSPNPTGSYTLSLQALPSAETEAGCLTGRVATWMVPGNEATAQAASNDCAFPNSSQRYDRYGVRLQAGDTVTVTVDAPFAYRVQYIDPSDGQAYTRAKPAAGGPAAQGVVVGQQDASHYFWILPDGGATGEYTIRVETGRASYQPCGQWFVLQVGGSVQGELEEGLDCVDSDGNVRDAYRVNAPVNQPFFTTLSSADFDPFLVGYKDGKQVAGRASTTGSTTSEHLYAGGFYEIAATALNGVPDGTRYSGVYTLSTSSAAIPQEGCPGGRFRSTFVYFGSVASGRVSSDDCRDLFAPDTATVTRWVDGYSILLQAGETVTVTLQADFVANFTRWVGNSFVEGQFGVQPGNTVSFTVTQPTSGAAFHTFNVISGEHQAVGNYTMSFSGTPLPGPQPVATGAAAWRAPRLLPGELLQGGEGGPAR